MQTYHYIFGTYGTWLHGDERGSIDRKGQTLRDKHLAPDPLLEAANRKRLKHSPITLDARQRGFIKKAIENDCKHRQREIRALNVRTNHVHAVIASDDASERVLQQIKAWATRSLRKADLLGDRPVWASGGFRQKCASPEAVPNAIRYVHSGQGPDLPTSTPDIPGVASRAIVRTWT